MESPTVDPGALGHRLAVAETAAADQTERTMQMVRGWALVAAVGQTAITGGDRPWVAWLAVVIVGITWLTVRMLLGVDAPIRRRQTDWFRGLVGRLGPARRQASLPLVGALAMAGDTAATAVAMFNLQSNPYHPVALMPLAVIIEAAVRWDLRGGVVGGLVAGAMNASWAALVHRRLDLELPAAFVSLRVLILLAVGATLGSTVRDARQQRRAASAVFNTSRDLIVTVDLGGVVRSVNPASEAILGYRPDELVGRHQGWLLEGDGGHLGVHQVEGYRRNWGRLVELAARHRDGHLVWLELDLVPDLDEGLIRAVGRDVTARRRNDAELRHRADHDGLTGVWNRRRMRDRFERVSGEDRHLGLVFIDLDDFKSVNDAWGHVAGDRVLVEVAARLSVETGVDGVVARYAGDEFCILVEDLSLLEGLADRVGHVLARPIDVGEVTLVVTAAVGTATGQPGEDVDAVVHRADQAMYRDKQQRLIT